MVSVKVRVYKFFAVLFIVLIFFVCMYISIAQFVDVLEQINQCGNFVYSPESLYAFFGFGLMTLGGFFIALYDSVLFREIPYFLNIFSTYLVAVGFVLLIVGPAIIEMFIRGYFLNHSYYICPRKGDWVKGYVSQTYAKNGMSCEDFQIQV